MYLGPPKTTFEKTPEANCQECEEFPLQLRKISKTEDSCKKSNA